MSRDPRNDRPVMSHLLYCERCNSYTPPTTASLGTLEPGCWVCGEPYLHQELTAGWCPECESRRTSHTVRCPDCDVSLLNQRSQGCDVCRLTGRYASPVPDRSPEHLWSVHRPAPYCHRQ